MERFLLGLWNMCAHEEYSRDPSSGSGGAPRPGDAACAVRVLLVDDSVLALETISWHLQHWGYGVQGVGDAEQALDLAARSRWDLFVLDVDMPKMNGLELLRRLSARFRGTPIVMLSSHAQSDLVLQAVREGAFDYVVKDEDLGPLRAAIEGALDDARMRRKNDELMVQLRSTNNVLEQQVALRAEQLATANRRLARERAELARAVRSLEDAQQRLLQADKLAALGVLTAGIAHEINNPLTFLQANLELVAQWLASTASGRAGDVVSYSAEVPSMIADCLAGLARIRNITKDLGVFSRRSDGVCAATDVKSVIESVVRLVGNEMRHRAKLTLRFSSECVAWANEEQLQQVILNLLINATHAIAAGRDDGQIVIETMLAGEELVVRVADNGCGIPRDALPKIFDPFFSTKPVGVGSGLGLAICHQLVQKMDGAIDVQSTEGVGSTFTLRFRAALGASAAAHGRVSAPDSASIAAPVDDTTDTKRRRLLLVDDEPAFLRSMKRLLGSAFEVATCASGASALEHLAEHGAPDVMLCDLVMPGMSGSELYAQACQRYPEILGRFAVLSGGAIVDADLAPTLPAEVPVLRKPFDAVELRRLLTDLARH